MKQEHDYSVALEALQRVAIAVCGVDYRTQAAFEGDIQTIRAALTAAKGDGWLPIESAPMTEDEILAYDAEYAGCPYQVITWTENFCSHGCFNPTHWKPLDKPPQDGGDDE